MSPAPRFNRWAIPSALLIIFVSTTVFSRGFRQYTTISGTLKNALRVNWQARFPGSGYTSGNVAVLGNSITYTNAFWRPFAYGTPGIVPGTNVASYTVEKGEATCAYTGYEITNGLGCVSGALASLKPEVAICEYGTNDIRDKQIGTFRADYERYLDALLAKGVIPIISTIPPMRMNNDAGYEPIRAAINDTIRNIARRKNVVLVDFYQALMDCSGNNPFSAMWMDADMVHPAGGCTLTDTANPHCGYGVRNAVCWQAVNKVYRIILENGTADDGTEDLVPPAAVRDLRAAGGPYKGNVTVTWTATGNDSVTGTAAICDLRWSASMITATNFMSATVVTPAPRPLTAGSTQTCVVNGLTPGATYYFALTISDGPNRSGISNIVSAAADNRTPLFSDSVVLNPTADNYLESGTDARSNWGANTYIRLKSDGQGIPLLGFPASSISFVPDSAILYLAVSADMPAASAYSYQANISGITAAWSELASSYNERSSGASWSGGNPANSFSPATGAVTTASFNGIQSDRPVHAFPVSGAVIRGLRQGTFYGIALWETGSSYNNVHFSSREGATLPKLVVYKKGTSAISEHSDLISESSPIAVRYGGNGLISIEVNRFGYHGYIKVRLLTCAGREIRASGSRSSLAGKISDFRWDARSLSAGSYLLQVSGGPVSAIRRITIGK